MFIETPTRLKISTAAAIPSGIFVSYFFLLYATPSSVTTKPNPAYSFFYFP
jgi:hypothetical protein